MYITPVATNYNNANVYRQNKITAPNFKGALNEAQMERVIKLLAQKNNEVFEDFSGLKLKRVMDNFMAKYECLGIRCVGIQILDNKDLPKVLGKDAAKYDIKGKMGLSVAVGDKFGPLENMNNIYEAKTFLLKESDLKNLR